MLKVSIIIPVYNVAKYIRRCIESVLAQEGSTFSLECIIVNDYSSDESVNIINDMIGDYQGGIEFVVCNHGFNKGVSAARNTGLRKATGDFVFFIDSDDYITNDCLRLMMDSLYNYPNIDVILGGTFSVKYDRNFYPPVPRPTLLMGGSEVLLKVFFAELHCHVWNRLLRRDFLIRNNLFFIEDIIYEDMPWTYKLYMTMSSMLVLPNCTYVYENNEKSIMNTTCYNVDYAVNSSCLVIEYILDNIFQEIRSDCRIFCFGILLRTLDMISKFPCSRNVEIKVSKVRNRLVKEAFLSCRLLMTIFFLTSYKPFVYIYNSRSIGLKYHKVTVLFSKLERFWDRIIDL